MNIEERGAVTIELSFDGNGTLTSAGSYVNGYKTGKWKNLEPYGTYNYTSLTDDPSSVSKKTPKNSVRVEVYDPKVHREESSICYSRHLQRNVPMLFLG